MRFRVCAVVLGLGALAATPTLALTVQAAPPRPDVAERLHPTSAAQSSSRALPGPDDLKYSFVASGRAQTGQGFYSPSTSGTTSFSFGPLHATTTVTLGYGYWNDGSLIDKGNPFSLAPPRR